jgi:uncharacterized protein YcbX
MTIEIARICRYPVKGLNAEALERVSLTPGEGLPHDRRFAIAHGSARLDRDSPAWLPKTSFFMLMKDEKLAQLRVRFEPESGRLSIERGGRQVVSADATNLMGRTLIAEFFSGFLAGDARGAPKFLETAGQSFFDVPEKLISIIGLASVRDLERVTRKPVDPLRFRANLYLEGGAPWEEFGWAGQEIAVGEARLRIVKPIERCAATNVDPETAQRDLNLPLTLQQGFGHMNMGVYAAVVEGGEVAEGNAVNAPA